jgi:hypothetical protein
VLAEINTCGQTIPGASQQRGKLCPPAGGLQDDDSTRDALHALQGGITLMTRLLHDFTPVAATSMTDASPSATAVLLGRVQVRGSVLTTMGIPASAAASSAGARRCTSCCRRRLPSSASGDRCTIILHVLLGMLHSSCAQGANSCFASTPSLADTAAYWWPLLTVGLAALQMLAAAPHLSLQGIAVVVSVCQLLALLMQQVQLPAALHACFPFGLMTLLTMAPAVNSPVQVSSSPACYSACLPDTHRHHIAGRRSLPRCQCASVCCAAAARGGESSRGTHVVEACLPLWAGKLVAESSTSR